MSKVKNGAVGKFGQPDFAPCNRSRKSIEEHRIERLIPDSRRADSLCYMSTGRDVNRRFPKIH